MRTVSKYDDFSQANDPHEEHDFGSFDFDDNKILWKISYFDNSLARHSLDPADPSVTTRVLTVMLAEEY